MSYTRKPSTIEKHWATSTGQSFYQCLGSIIPDWIIKKIVFHTLYFVSNSLSCFVELYINKSQPEVGIIQKTSQANCTVANKLRVGQHFFYRICKLHKKHRTTRKTGYTSQTRRICASVLFFIVKCFLLYLHLCIKMNKPSFLPCYRLFTF